MTTSALESTITPTHKSHDTTPLWVKPYKGVCNDDQISNNHCNSLKLSLILHILRWDYIPTLCTLPAVIHLWAATGPSNLTKAPSEKTLQSNHKQQLAKAIVRMLRPLIRLLIRHEVTQSDLNELVRQTYVEVVLEHFSIPNQEMTNSRVAVLTGLSRKEVVRLREALDGDDSLQKQKPNRAQRVVNGWLTDKEFLDKNKKPKILPIKKLRAGKQHASFMALVKRYSGDITYGVVLEELNHVGVTKQPDENSVELINSAYVPRKDELEQVRVAAGCIADLFNTTNHNMLSADSDKRFQRQVVYNGIDPNDVEEFKLLTTDKAGPVIQDLNAFLDKKQKANKAKIDKQAKKDNKETDANQTKRLGFGIYYIEDE